MFSCHDSMEDNFDMANGHNSIVKIADSTSSSSNSSSSSHQNDNQRIGQAASAASGTASADLPAAEASEERDLGLVNNDKRKSFTEMTELFYSRGLDPFVTPVSLSTAAMTETACGSRSGNQKYTEQPDQHEMEDGEELVEPLPSRPAECGAPPPLALQHECNSNTGSTDQDICSNTELDNVIGSGSAIGNKSRLLAPRRIAVKKSRIVPPRIDCGKIMSMSTPGSYMPSSSSLSSHMTTTACAEELYAQQHADDAAPVPILKSEKRVHFQPEEFNLVDYCLAMEIESHSLIRDYIRTEQGAGSSRPSIMTYKTEDVIHMQYDDHKAQPLAPACEKGYTPSIPVKQTVASRKRLEKLHLENQLKVERLEADNHEYIPPLQRRDLAIKELKRQLQETYYVIQQRDMEIDMLHMTKEDDLRGSLAEKEEIINILLQRKAKLEAEQEKVRIKQEEYGRTADELEAKLMKLQEEQEERQQAHQEIYLAMYQKGRDTASFEKRDELEVVAASEETSDPAEIMELLERMRHAQSELQYWHEVKSDSVTVGSRGFPQEQGAEASATLKFMKDALYHYLTDKHKSTEHHLTAMTGILNYPAEELELIKKGMDEKRRRGRI